MQLEIKNLVVHYGKAEALRGISLNVEEGSVVTLIGANGAGKTTTLRTISGLKMATSGEIWYQGKKLNRTPPHQIVNMGIAHVPEGRRLFPALTVMVNLKMGAYLRKHQSEIAKDLKRMYKHFPVLEARQKQIASSLSGGEQQILAVARALMSSPKLLLMDEPSMGLSPLLVKEIGRIITDINREGVSILLVEQNANMALKLANRAYVMEVGTIALEGDAQKLASDEHVRRTYLGG
jgi:branched-chain amino acid transport system ATP-binding protein